MELVNSKLVTCEKGMPEWPHATARASPSTAILLRFTCGPSHHASSIRGSPSDAAQQDVRRISRKRAERVWPMGGREQSRVLRDRFRKRS